MHLYDKAIRPGPNASILDAIDASALLWRLHLVGLSFDQRWDELATLWASWEQEGYYAFNDAHAMMAYVAADRRDDACNLLEILERRVDGVGSNAAMTRGSGATRGTISSSFGTLTYEMLDTRSTRSWSENSTSHRGGSVWARSNMASTTPSPNPTIKYLPRTPHRRFGNWGCSGNW